MKDEKTSVIICKVIFLNKYDYLKVKHNIYTGLFSNVL